MFKLYKIIFLLFFAISLQSQNALTIIEKLKDELKTNPSLKRQAVIYSDLTWYYSNVSIDSALANGSKALDISLSLGDSTLIAQVFSDIAAVYFRKGEFENSKHNYQKAYTIRKAQKDSKGLAKINNNLANIYEKTQQYNLAMSYFLDALQYFESINDQKNIHVIKGNIGLILLKIKNFEKALAYLSEVVNYQTILNSTEDLCISCINLGNVYLHLKDTTNALKMYEKSIKFCISVGNKKGLASAYNNIATIKSLQKKSKDAMLFFAKSAKERQELNSDLDKANFDLNLANEFIAKREYPTAKNLLISVEKIYEKSNSTSNLLTSYKSLIDVYSHLNSPDSVTLYVRKLIDANNILLENSIRKQTDELEIKYQTIKKEKLLLQKEIEAREQRILLIRISAITILVVLMSLLFYLHQRLKRKQQIREFALRTEISEIETQNLLQEQRISISRDLHDNIGSHLTFIISSINNLMYKYKSQNEILYQQLQKIEDFASGTISELRDTIWAMDKTNFKLDDLKTRLINFIEKQKSIHPDFKIEFDVNDNLELQQLNSYSGITIYRIIQEFTNNTLKHSNASILTIKIIQENDLLTLQIKDNGIGFNVENCKRGHGLYNMEKRSEELNGRFNIESVIGKGTSIIIIFNTKYLI